MCPSVSVILPTFNRASLLGRAIESVLNQTYQDYELIIIDDGSTDNTEEIVRGFGAEKIRYVKHDRNRGVSAARNTGLRIAGGKYITFQDSDDEWMPGKLEKQVAALATAPPDVGIVYCDSTLVMHGKKQYVRCSEYLGKNHNVFRSITERHFVTTPILMLRRQCFEEAGGFDESLPVLDDWDLFLRMSKLYAYAGIDEFLVTRYLQPDSLSVIDRYYAIALRLLVNKYYYDIRQDTKLLAKCYLKLGHCLVFQGDTGQGRGYLLQGLGMNPLDPRFYIAWLLSLSGKTLYGRLVKIFRRIRLAVTGNQY